jgi:hypothetical protein
MKHATPKQSSYAALFDPVVARAAAARAAQWNLPRHECHPLDRYAGKRVAADLAAFDASVERAPVFEEEIENEPQQTCGRPERESDADSDEDL